MEQVSTALVQGASRGIGLAMVREVLSRRPGHHVIATARNPAASQALSELERTHRGQLHLVRLDVTNERSIAAAAASTRELTSDLSLLVNAAGVLHGPGFQPEKKLGHVDSASLETVFAVNAFGPLLVAKHFVDFFRHAERSVFASLSARVGSISDNRLGGWYAYRASKAAQNMFTKNVAIEFGRICPSAIVIGLHPGTVDTDLSKPFQRNVPEGGLFTPELAAKRLLDVVEAATPSDSGQVFDYDARRITP